MSTCSHLTRFFIVKQWQNVNKEIIKYLTTGAVKINDIELVQNGMSRQLLEEKNKRLTDQKTQRNQETLLSYISVFNESHTKMAQTDFLMKIIKLMTVLTSTTFSLINN